MAKILEIEKRTKERQLWNARSTVDDIMYCHVIGQEAQERTLLDQVDLIITKPVKENLSGICISWSISESGLNQRAHPSVTSETNICSRNQLPSIYAPVRDYRLLLSNPLLPKIVEVLKTDAKPTTPE